MTFRFGTERMRLLRRHRRTTARKLSLVRRKGNGITLASADGTDIPPAGGTGACSAAPTRRCFANCSASTPRCCAPAATT